MIMMNIMRIVVMMMVMVVLIMMTKMQEKLIEEVLEGSWIVVDDAVCGRDHFG